MKRETQKSIKKITKNDSFRNKQKKKLDTSNRVS